MPQLQHNMWVIAARTAALSVITGGGKWVEIKINADPLYQHLLVERFQSSNHMGCSKRPHPWDGRSKMQLCGFMKSVV